MKNKHRIKQGLSLLLAGALTFTNVGAALPAFAEDAPATPETASAATPESAEANVPTPNLSQITENLYNDLPDAPTGSYLGSMGLPVATGETKIGISAWVSDLYDGVDAHMDADALNADENTVTIGKTPGTDYAIVPLLAQVEYPADGAVSEIILPDDVELLSYRSTDYEPIPADEQEQAEILHQTYSEQSAAATGLYVKASADFTAQLVYTDSDGSSQSKSIQVQISEDVTPTQMYADTGDDGIAAYAAGPTPPYTTGKITSIAKEGGTWLIWFNGQEAYCCSHGLNGQPKGCPTYSFSHVSRLEPGQYTPGNHYANQVNIWGGLGQLSLDMLDDRPVVASLEDDPEGCEEQPDILGSLYDETQQWIMENYPDSYAAQTYIAAAEELINGTDAQSGENGYYTYIYNPPAGYAWQVVALVGEEIAGGTEIPDVPSVPEPKYYSAAWTAPAQTAGGSFDLTFTVNTDKVQLNTLEKVDGAVITVTPSRTGGSVDGGSWKMSPAGAQTITTSGHTQDDSFHLNGGDGSATWTVHYEVSKTSTSTLTGQEGPFTSQAEADAAAEAAKNAAIGQLQNEAQGMVDAAIASARAQLANITFSYDEITIPHGFDSTPGALGSHQTITAPANSANDYQMKNDEWSVKVSIDKIDSETKQRIKGDAEFKIFAWDTVRQCYIPFGGYNRYKVERQADGTYKVINHSDYAGGSDDLFYTQRNEGKFVIVESRAPSGYYGDWTDVNTPGTAGSVLGKRAYAFEITKAQDGQTIWLGNADYNADIITANSGGTLIDTGEGIVTITFGSRKADKYKLSVIDTENSNHVAKPYAEWLAEKNGHPTWRTAIRQDVDAAIGQSLTWRQFLSALERKGYEVRMGRKYPVLRPPGKKRFVRFKTLGKRYTPEAIQTRILYPRSYRPYVENPPTIQRARLRDNGKPRRKLTGLRALYYRYLYELGALPRKPRRPSYAVRQDAYKLDQRIRQMEFLSKNNIDTLAQLETYRLAKLGEIVQLTSERKSLYKTNPNSPRIQQISTAIKQLRQEERLCRKIAEHSIEVQQHLTEARRDRAEQQKQEQECARDRRPNIDLTL